MKPSRFAEPKTILIPWLVKDSLCEYTAEHHQHQKPPYALNPNYNTFWSHQIQPLKLKDHTWRNRNRCRWFSRFCIDVRFFKWRKAKVRFREVWKLERREEVLIWGKRKCWAGIREDCCGDEMARVCAATGGDGDTAEKNVCCVKWSLNESLLLMTKVKK